MRHQFSTLKCCIFASVLPWLMHSAAAELSDTRKAQLIQLVEEPRYDCKYLPAEEKEFLKGYFYEVKKHTDPEAHDYQLLQVGDEPTIERYIKEFEYTGMNMTGFPRASGQARFIETFAPAMFREEPLVFSEGDTPGAAPLSYGVTCNIIQLLRESPQLSPEVRHWAFSLNPDDLERNRTLLRKWWKENEKQFKERNYIAVKPLQEQSPPPLLPDNPSPPANDNRHTLPATPASAPVAAPEPSSLPAILITALCVALLAAALWLAARRGKSSP